MADPIKRAPDGRFASSTVKTLAEGAQARTKVLQSATDAETTRKAVVTAFAKATTVALAEGAGAGSALAGAKAVPSALALAVGGIVGQKLADDKGKAIGQIVGSTIGGLTGGLPGAIAGGVGAAISLEKSSKQSLAGEIDRATQLKDKAKSSAKYTNMASPALENIDKSLKAAATKIGTAADRQIQQIETELARQGLSEAVDTTLRTGGAAAAKGAIGTALAGGSLVAGAVKGLPRIGMGLGATAGDNLGEKIAGKAGKAIGSTIGGAIGGAVSGTLMTGSAGTFPGAAVGLSAVPPADLAEFVRSGSPLVTGRVTRPAGSPAQKTRQRDQVATSAQQLGDAAKRLASASKVRVG